MDILRYIAIGMGLIIIFVGFILVILAESAPERMIDFLETLALAMLGRRAPRRRRRIYAVQPPAQERAEALEHEHHELVLRHHRRRRVPWRLVGAVLIPMLTFLMGYPLVHQTPRIAKTQCPPAANRQVLWHPRYRDDIVAQTQDDRPCPSMAGDGFCGLVERHVPFLEPILVALHVCPEQSSSVVTTVQSVSRVQEKGAH